MIFNELIAKYGGEDLISFYLKSFFGIDLKGINNARDYFIRFEHFEPFCYAFDKIYYRRGFVPKEGDICVWGFGVNGGKGRASIATGKGNERRFYGFEINRKKQKIRKKRYSYKFFLGVLRPKSNCFLLENKK